ncbi:MAG: hypothetical protein UV58_C0007G0014 [Candidatus Wolfebacteria bacterium GW2011_GWC1_43_10]|uniref:Uncharacterized protein n=2 Tax=Candidatus Wolfeibacteriota TaxID=1752735 RepID=A0A0G1CAI7_9BACT|nr:MAG: hypothetical protein UV58_C0007G0014 [Candidatus Wolfebacteria bacterium GW2011_GWC1_43_10]KKT22144.1 MAG: hypothetical protein UW08_C0016G0006 [Parcubacteria group bacterium GW2011_GWB1_43_8b]
MLKVKNINMFERLMAEKRKEPDGGDPNNKDNKEKEMEMTGECEYCGGVILPGQEDYHRNKTCVLEDKKEKTFIFKNIPADKPELLNKRKKEENINTSDKKEIN